MLRNLNCLENSPGFTSIAGFNVILSYNGLGADHKASPFFIQAECTACTQMILYHG
jgi:hypothetical protein